MEDITQDKHVMKSPAHSVTVLLCLYHDLGLWLSNFSLSTVCTSVSTSFCISNRCSQLQILVRLQVEVTQHHSTLVVTLSNERRILVNNFTEGWGLGKLLECWLFRKYTQLLQNQKRNFVIS